MRSDLPVYVHDYRRLWWSRVREHLGSRVVDLLLAGVGLVGGLWLTGMWTYSDVVKAGVVLGCVVGTMITGWAVRKRIRLARGEVPRPLDRADLIRLTIRGEIAVVVPPYNRGDSWVVAAAAAVGILLFQGFDALDAGPGSVVVATFMGGVAGSAIVRGATWLARPGFAMFADRVEIRRGLGRYVIPWSAIAGAGEERGRLVVYVDQTDMVLRKGTVPRNPRYGVRARDFALPASVVADAVERFRRDPTARGSIPSVPPRVVDDGSP